MASDNVAVKRPDGEIVQVSRRAYEGIYQYRKGWRVVELYPDLEKKTRAELDQIAIDRGLDPDEYGKKADLLAALEGSDE